MEEEKPPCTETGIAALRILLEFDESEKLTVLRKQADFMRRRLNEIAKFAPVAKALKGQFFYLQHMRVGNYLPTPDGRVAWFMYKGRTVKTGKGDNITPAGLLIFEHVFNATVHNFPPEQRTAHMDAQIDAWKPYSTPWYDKDGNPIPYHMCLPLNECFHFNLQGIDRQQTGQEIALQNMFATAAAQAAAAQEETNNLINNFIDVVHD